MSSVETGEPLIVKKSTSSCSGKTICGGGVVFAALVVGAISVYALNGHQQQQRQDAAFSSSSPISRIISGDVNVKELSPMKSEWSYFNDYVLELKELSLYTMSGQLLHESSYETTFTVNYHDRVLQLSRKNLATNEITDTLYSTQGEASSSPIYQYSHGEVISEGIKGFEDFLSSDLVTDTYVISLKLAQYGLSGKSAPVVKGFHSVAQTLAKQGKGFTAEMKTVVSEINAKMAEEKSKDQTVSLLWNAHATETLQGKLRYGPCSRYEDCTCDIESKCGNDCYGMCGADCNCWMFVCGDCDCHCFCYDHDNYCSCYSIADLHCWNIWLWFDACC